ncbi:branched-chain-amino-acid transaminase [Candidatus Aerophobetes bacterium]|uniref:Branched-chain-amino-acid aminotransferase n=1 Tax=Aerophobetes bacterium TaxID=2030807 RepID=A0A523UYW0_UNCAE|nr:MAG: branched-chain-amino-acid transaminase [Candidatus Aerophobetes bacterium]
MKRWIYIDGKFLPEEEAKISVFDHGFLYGDGVFEGIRAYGGRVFKLEEHLTRLWDSARAINLTIPLSKDELREKILETLRHNKLKDAYLRLLVSRGKGDLGLDPRKCPRSSLIIIAHKISVYPEDFYEKGLEVIVASTRRNAPSALNARIKSLNYLNNILAKIEANFQGMGEAIMLSQDGYVAEGAADNIFVVKDGELLTPPTWIGILKGITRDVVIELAEKEGLPVKEETFTPFSLYSCHECFLTGTAAEIIPVTKVDGKIIGEGKAGPITKKLIEKFQQYTREEGIPIY